MTERFDEHDDETMDSLVRALEAAPAVTVPPDFAARVMARVPQRSRAMRLRQAPLLTPRYGPVAAFAALGVVLLGMLWVARMPAIANVWSGLQLLLTAQFCGYVLWIGFASWRRR